MPGRGASPKKGAKKGAKKGVKKRKGRKKPGPTGPPTEPLSHSEIVDAYYVCHNAAHFLTYTGFARAEPKKKARKGKKKKK